MGEFVVIKGQRFFKVIVKIYILVKFFFLFCLKPDLPSNTIKYTVLASKHNIFQKMYMTMLARRSYTWEEPKIIKLLTYEDWLNVVIYSDSRACNFAGLRKLFNGLITAL